MSRDRLCVMMRNRFGKNVFCGRDDMDCHLCDRPGKMGARRNDKKEMWEFDTEKLPFKIDMESSNKQYLHVDVENLGRVVIKIEDEGIVVDIFSLHNDEDAVASTYAFADELQEEEDDGI